MSNNFEKSIYQKKADSHLNSWQDEIDNSVGKNTRELGIYNKIEIGSKLNKLFQN